MAGFKKKEDALKFIDYLKGKEKAVVESIQKKKNKENPQLILSTAWGLAMSTECYDDYDSHSAYRIADARMYENKRNSKMGRKD